MKNSVKMKLTVVWVGSIVWWMFIGKDLEQRPSWDTMLAFGVFWVTSFTLLVLWTGIFISWAGRFLSWAVNRMSWVIGYFIGLNK